MLLCSLFQKQEAELFKERDSSNQPGSCPPPGGLTEIQIQASPPWRPCPEVVPPTPSIPEKRTWAESPSPGCLCPGCPASVHVSSESPKAAHLTGHLPCQLPGECNSPHPTPFIDRPLPVHRLAQPMGWPPGLRKYDMLKRNQVVDEQNYLIKCETSTVPGLLPSGTGDTVFLVSITQTGCDKPRTSSSRPDVLT